MEHHLWIEKYRPKTIDNVISHKNILQTLNKLIEKKEFPHLLFYGPPGTGKTSIILTLARKLNGEHYRSMILELNASDNRNIDVVQNCIQDFARTQQIFNKGYKLIILDEVDSMDESTQISLRRIMEEYHRNIRFCLICNYVNKIIPSLQSRCTRFRFPVINELDMKKRLKHVIKKENIKIDTRAITAVVNISNGDMRKALNSLQSNHLTYPSVTQEQIYMSSGLPLPKEITQMYNKIKKSSFEKSYNFILELMQRKGYSLIDIVNLTYKKILKDKYDDDRLIYILDKISNVEYYLSFGSSDKVQLAHFIAILKKKLNLKKPSYN